MTYAILPRRCCSSGEPHPKVVQEMLGHSTIAITLDLYSHVIPTMHRDAAQQFGRLFEQPAAVAERQA